jgi:hypothetical protein
MPRLRHLVPGVAVLLALGVTGASSVEAGPSLRWRVFAYNVPRAVSIVWTGKQFLYVQNTENTVWKAPASGSPITVFGKMPKIVEETRCVRSPGAHGFPPGAIFCHTPDHKIYEFSADGRHRSVFAVLPTAFPPADDGALAFDDVGRFGYRLVAATGRTGAPEPAGGTVYALDAKGHVQTIGTYPGPGGADEVAIAPPGFGDAAGDALLTGDAGTAGGQLIAVAPDGTARSLVTFPDGLNPIVILGAPTARPTPRPAPGLYLTNDISGYVYYAPSSTLRSYTGDVLVGSEGKALFWIVQPKAGGGFVSAPVPSNLGRTKMSLEAMIQIR